MPTLIGTSIVTNNFFYMNLFSCLNLKTSSDYLLISSSGYGEVMVASFSLKYREHIFVMFEYAFSFRKICHVGARVMLFLFFISYT